MSDGPVGTPLWRMAERYVIAKKQLEVIATICEQAEEDGAWVSAVRKIQEVASR